MTAPVTSEQPDQSPVVERTLSDVVIRFAGDSGDGMQLTGTQFTNTSALVGNDLSTLPDFPAEIRAPAGTLPGVSAFQVRIADHDIHTPGDAPDVLVAMNPAALKTNLGDLKRGGIVIVNTDEFDDRNLKKANYATNPLEDGSLKDYKVHQVPITSLTRRAEDLGLDTKTQDRSRNLFALGMSYWLFSRPMETTLQWLKDKFGKQPKIVEANIRVLKAGWNYCDITHIFHERYEVAPAQLEAGPIATSWATRPSPWAWWPPAGAAASRSSSAPTRSRRPPTCCTSSRPTRSSASPPCRPKTRSRRCARRSALRSAARSA